MSKLINRRQVGQLTEMLKSFPVVAVVGARQTGKTTLVRKLLKEKQKREFFTLDDPEVVLAAEQNPLSFLSRYPRLTIDEIQKVPALFPAIKRMVDEKRSAGQFIITGSANITMLPKIGETLAGRIAFVELPPLTIAEVQAGDRGKPRLIELLLCRTAQKAWQILESFKTSSLPLEKMVFRGGYPTAWLEKNDARRQEWFKAYIMTYLERDVRDLSRIQKLYEYQKFLSLAAFRCGQILNRSDLARDAGVAPSTANHFFDLLLATFQIFLVEPYFRNIGKRLIKSPKLMWNDTGLAAHLQGMNRWSDAQRLGRSGFLVENKIAQEIKSILAIDLPLAKLFYWRTSAGAEVDLVIEHNGRLIPIEIKWREKVSKRDVLGLINFLKDFGSDVPWGIVLYRGKNLLQIEERVFLVPMDKIFGGD